MSEKLEKIQQLMPLGKMQEVNALVESALQEGISPQEPSIAFTGAVIRCWCWKQGRRLRSAGRWRFQRLFMTEAARLRE